MIKKKSETRFTVGIDLGTTNSVLSYIDHDEDHPVPHTLAVPQVVAPGEVQALNSLPSFIYIPLEAEAGKGLFKLPWQKAEAPMVVGTYARERAAYAPSRVVSSSKSWLCSQRIDRHAPCLPFTGDAQDGRLSPVQAAQLILEHLKDAWNADIAAGKPALALEKQSVIITVPASFDAVARELTVEAAHAAGLTFTLLEEPQAAFYAWLAEHDEDWRNTIGNGDVVLVCDIGGGTTDFSLIAVTDVDGNLQLQRLAVGNHTLLGGDNMDIALAMSVSARLAAEKKTTLDTYQLMALTHACRRAKEALGGGDCRPQTLTILGRGSSLMGNTITTTLSEDDLKGTLLEGFFPFCSIDDKVLEARRGGLRTFALDYATDPAFTRHLAQFLEQHSFRDGDGKPMLPRIILFNGGVTKAPVFRRRLVEQVQTWSGSAEPCAVLEMPDPDLSVACGAAWFAHVNQCGGIRIKAGSARSYYIGVESPMPAIPGFTPPLEALCVVNHGMEEGTELQIPVGGMAFVVGENTDFQLFTSTVRPEDNVGMRVSGWKEGELVKMPPLTITLPEDVAKGEHPGALVPVNLRTVLTDIGTLQLWGDEAGGERHWKLEYELRDTPEQSRK